MTKTRTPKPRGRIYPIDGGFLFVPTEDMWNVHEASKPSAILARARLGEKDWYQWKRKYEADYPWLPEWLYGSSAMASNGSATGFQPNDFMLAFRREARIRSVLAAASRTEERMNRAWRRDYRPYIKDSLLSNWRTLYKKFEWFDPWLLRGEKLPPEVQLLPFSRFGAAPEHGIILPFVSALEHKQTAPFCCGSAGVKSRPLAG